MEKFSANLKKVSAVSGFIKKIKGISCDFDNFGDFSKLILYRKSHGSDLRITRPRLPLDPWWARREREEVVRFPPMTPLRGGVDGHMTELNKGDWLCSDGEMVLGVRRKDWSRSGHGG
jgi:hypothetical protein